MKNYKVGIYLRLSRDDGNTDNESMSISNQRDMIVSYVEESGWQLEEIYIDDGISGTTFDRSGFLRMIADIENKRINMVIVKDLSRLGRNYTKVGHFTETYFPEHKVRFIAIGDNVDSDKENDFAGFLNVIYEHYAKDTSRKIKSAKHSLMKKGMFMGSQPPMGYIKDPNDKHTLIIDEGSKVIIERIFQLYSIGHTARNVADIFNNEGVLAPREYFYNLIGKPNPYTNDSVLWGSSTIMRMLRNQVYIGHMCQGKRRNRSFKLKNRDIVPQSEWMVVENTHEAIIDEVTWARVQDVLNLNKSNRKPKSLTNNDNKEPSLFAGKLRCADCNAVMSYTYSQVTGYRKYYKYRCSTYTNQGKSACSFHSIMEDEVNAIVLNDIQKASELIVTNSDEILNLLLDLNSRTQQKSYSKLENKIKASEKRIIHRQK